MGLYFRKRKSLFGNLLNFSLTGAGLGVSLGVRGFRAGLSSSGRRYVSASLPGTGLYLKHYFPHHASTVPRWSVRHIWQFRILCPPSLTRTALPLPWATYSDGC